MGLFKKVKDILFDEEEYTEQIKITPEMRNEETPSKEEKKVAPAPERPVVRKEEYRERPAIIKETKLPDEARPAKIASDNLSERELFKSESTFPFLDFDEEEFDSQKPTTRVASNMQTNKVPPKRSTNVFEYERKKKVEKRTDYGRFEKVETTESIERKRFKPSPIISPVYGILNQDYVKEEIMNKSDLDPNRPIDINEVRNRAFGDKRNTIVEEIPSKNSYYEESKTVTITPKAEKEKKVKTIDELLEDTSDVTIDIAQDIDEDIENVLPRLNKRDDFEDTKEITQEMKMPEPEEDTLENDLFDLIDSMYDNKEDGD